MTQRAQRRKDAEKTGEEKVEGISPNLESDGLEEVLILDESKTFFSFFSFFSASLRLCVLCVTAFCLLPENFARPVGD